MSLFHHYAVWVSDPTDPAQPIVRVGRYAWHPEALAAAEDHRRSIRAESLRPTRVVSITRRPGMHPDQLVWVLLALMAVAVIVLEPRGYRMLIAAVIGVMVLDARSCAIAWQHPDPTAPEHQA